MLNRSYTHKDVLTRASLTIQIIDDMVLYKAQLFSSNGNIFSSRDESSDLHVKVFKGLDDITAKFSDIVWKRFTSNSNNVEEDLNWGEQHAGKTSIIITKEDIKEKANIQVEVYCLIDGERTLVGADFITFIDVNDMQGSDTPPPNPNHGDLWLDTSVSPPKLMVWDENLGMWIEVVMAGQDRRNLIRHSNFYRKNFDFWTPVNNPVLEIEFTPNNKWARIKSDIINNDYCGISQTVKATTKSKYSFQMLSEIYIQSAHPNGNAVIAFYSVDTSDVRTLIKEESFDIKTEPKTFTSTFETLSNTDRIDMIISGNEDATFDFVVTNIKLENHPIPTAWELAIEDIQDALDQKVGNTSEEVFNSLTDNGKVQGIYMSDKQLYINGQYINAYNFKAVRKDNPEDVTFLIDEDGEVHIKAKSLSITGDVDLPNIENYRLEVLSSNGNIFTNGDIQTQLIAKVYNGNKEVTSTLEDTCFYWTRTSVNTNEDELWNELIGKHKKNINITSNDVNEKATFECFLDF